MASDWKPFSGGGSAFVECVAGWGCAPNSGGDSDASRQWQFKGFFLLSFWSNSAFPFGVAKEEKRKYFPVDIFPRINRNQFNVDQGNWKIRKSFYWIYHLAQKPKKPNTAVHSASLPSCHSLSLSFPHPAGFESCQIVNSASHQQTKRKPNPRLLDPLSRACLKWNCGKWSFVRVTAGRKQ